MLNTIIDSNKNTFVGFRRSNASIKSDAPYFTLKTANFGIELDRKGNARCPDDADFIRLDLQQQNFGYCSNFTNPRKKPIPRDPR